MNYYAGIDIGGTNIKCGIIDENAYLIATKSVSTNRNRPAEVVINDIVSLINRMRDETNLEIKAIGIGCPGCIDSSSGEVIYSNDLGWRNVKIVQQICSQCDLPAFVTNDANAAGLGEHFCGAGAKYSSMVLLTIGTGIGSGIIIDGKLYEGNRGAGAEIGHETIRFDGEKCTCGRRGCFEAYASTSALIRQTKQAMEKNNYSYLWEISGGLENVNGKTAFDGMRAGDPVAIKIVNRYINYLTEGIVNVINVFRPQAILLGGGICAEGDTLLNPIRKKVIKMMFGSSLYAPVDIISAGLGNSAGIYGAAKFAINKLCKKKEFI